MDSDEEESERRRVARNAQEMHGSRRGLFFVDGGGIVFHPRRVKSNTPTLLGKVPTVIKIGLKYIDVCASLNQWIRKKKKVDERLLYAIFKECVELGEDRLMRKMIKWGFFEGHMKDTKGNTPLHYAMIIKGFAYVSGILEVTNDVNEKNKDGSAAIHLAAVGGNKKNRIVKYLLALGGDIHLKDRLGRTALHIAALHHNEEFTRELLEYGADVNITSNDGSVPLQLNPSSKVLKKHIITLKMMRLPVCEKNKRLLAFEIDDDDDPLCYQQRIELTKEDKINDTNITVYQVLTCSNNYLRVYGSNKELRRKPSKTPRKWYDGLLDARLKMGRVRKIIFDLSIDSLEFASRKLFHNVFADTICETIIEDLSNEDMKNLIDAVYEDEEDETQVVETPKKPQPDRREIRMKLLKL